jgi:TolB protein
MVDVEGRLGRLGRTPAPDLWPDIERRSPGRQRPSVSWVRFAVAAVALAVATAGVAVVVRAFVGEEDRRPSAAPGGEIAYVVRGYSTGPWSDARIFLMNADGSGKTELVAGGTPAWSPDGEQIAYVSDIHERSESHLSVIDADGTEARILYTFSPREPGGSPAWSPDGRWIAFQTGEGIFVISPEGDPARQVTEPPTETPWGPARCWDGQPSWSPDGQRIVFVVDCALKPRRTGKHLGLWTVRLDGSDRRQLLAFPSGDHGMYATPRWSPDGEHISFVIVEWRGDFRSRVAVMDADGSNVRTLKLGHAPAWSPDGRWLAFTGRDPNDVLDGPIAIMTLDGTIVRTLTPEPTFIGEGRQYCCPAWQPAG